MPDTVVAQWTRACDSQLWWHVCPIWRYAPERVYFHSDVTTVSPSAWPIYVIDDPDIAGALGYHDLDPHGRPYGRVFVKTSLDAGSSVSSVLSHEVIEAFVDPDINAWCSDFQGNMYALEACDPVQSSYYKITLGGVATEVSNFVTPDWFKKGSKKRMDWLRHLSRPFELERGGYAIITDENNERAIFANQPRSAVMRSKELPGARTVRRLHDTP